ncbi:unnamed protein product [Pedinophyceae sp. YPF-701]|nr:unnamed protein product [Pedinophyceae sp. YPF-701]
MTKGKSRSKTQKALDDAVAALATALGDGAGNHDTTRDQGQLAGSVEAIAEVVRFGPLLADLQPKAALLVRAFKLCLKTAQESKNEEEAFQLVAATQDILRCCHADSTTKNAHASKATLAEWAAHGQGVKSSMQAIVCEDTLAAINSDSLTVALRREVSYVMAELHVRCKANAEKVVRAKKGPALIHRLVEAAKDANDVFVQIDVLEIVYRALLHQGLEAADTIDMPGGATARLRQMLGEGKRVDLIASLRQLSLELNRGLPGRSKVQSFEVQRLEIGPHKVDCEARATFVDISPLHTTFQVPADSTITAGAEAEDGQAVCVDFEHDKLHDILSSSEDGTFTVTIKADPPASLRPGAVASDDFVLFSLRCESDYRAVLSCFRDHKHRFPAFFESNAIGSAGEDPVSDFLCDDEDLGERGEEQPPQEPKVADGNLVASQLGLADLTCDEDTPALILKPDARSELANEGKQAVQGFRRRLGKTSNKVKPPVVARDGDAKQQSRKSGLLAALAHDAKPADDGVLDFGALEGFDGGDGGGDGGGRSPPLSFEPASFELPLPSLEPSHADATEDGGGGRDCAAGEKSPTGPRAGRNLEPVPTSKAVDAVVPAKPVEKKERKKSASSSKQAQRKPPAKAKVEKAKAVPRRTNPRRAAAETAMAAIHATERAPAPSTAQAAADGAKDGGAGQVLKTFGKPKPAAAPAAKAKQSKKAGKHISAPEARGQRTTPPRSAAPPEHRSRAGADIEPLNLANALAAAGVTPAREQEQRPHPPLPPLPPPRPVAQDVDEDLGGLQADDQTPRTHATPVHNEVRRVSATAGVKTPATLAQGAENAASAIEEALQCFDCSDTDMIQTLLTALAHKRQMQARLEQEHAMQDLRQSLMQTADLVNADLVKFETEVFEHFEGQLLAFDAARTREVAALVDTQRKKMAERVNTHRKRLRELVESAAGRVEKMHDELQRKKQRVARGRAQGEPGRPPLAFH